MHIIGALYDSGGDAIMNMSDTPIEKSKKIMDAIKKKKKKKRAMLTAAMAGLLQSSRHVVRRYIRDKRESDRRALRADKRQK